jgi:serine/threonine protein kinase
LTEPTRIAGTTIVRTIGQGGFATVYEVRDSRNRRRAVKQLLKKRFGDPLVVNGFKKEAQFLRKNRIEGVVEAYNYSHGEHALVMEYLHGISLDRVLLSHFKDFDKSVRLKIGIEICETVARIHEANALHLDLKPGNIMICADGRVVLTDFGVAATIAASGNPELVMGTTNRMAPEQLLGHGEIGAHTDIFSLGVLLYELLSGTRPYSIEQANHLREQLVQVKPLDKVSKNTANAVRKAFSFEQTKRQSSASELAAALRREPGPHPTPAVISAAVNKALRSEEARRPTTKIRVIPDTSSFRTYPVPRHHWLRWAGVISIVVVVATVSLLLMLLRSPEPVPVNATPTTVYLPTVSEPTVPPDSTNHEPTLLAEPTVGHETPTAEVVQELVGSMKLFCIPTNASVTSLYRLDDRRSYLSLVPDRRCPETIDRLPVGTYRISVILRKWEQDRWKELPMETTVVIREGSVERPKFTWPTPKPSGR